MFPFVDVILFSISGFDYNSKYNLTYMCVLTISSGNNGYRLFNTCISLLYYRYIFLTLPVPRLEFSREARSLPFLARMVFLGSQFQPHVTYMCRAMVWDKIYINVCYENICTTRLELRKECSMLFWSVMYMCTWIVSVHWLFVNMIFLTAL